jgi:argininosuccinate lyase
VTDYRLWLLNELKATRKALQTMIAVACDRAEAESAVLMPGFTHLQPAQTVRWGHWLMCHCSTWQRDDERLRDLTPRVAMLPLGSGALAGNPFLVDRQFLSKVRCLAWTLSVFCQSSPLHTSIGHVLSLALCSERSQVCLYPSVC